MNSQSACSAAAVVMLVFTVEDLHLKAKPSQGLPLRSAAYGNGGYQVAQDGHGQAEQYRISQGMVLQCAISTGQVASGDERALACTRTV